VARLRAAVSEQRRHLERAYDLTTSIFSAVNLEKLERDERVKANQSVREKSKDEHAEGLERVNQDQCVDPRGISRQPSSQFLNRVEIIRPMVEEAEFAFRAAAQRYAQVRYGRGMVLGIGLLVLLCAALGIVFSAHDTPAWYGVALAAGGAGAVVSVLQRMASAKLHLDYNAGGGMLTTLGAVRPLIGATFGMVLFAVVDGGWLPSIDISHEKPLSFYAVLGFLAGFNERFAQDMLVGSAKHLSGQFDAGSNEGTSRSPGGGLNP
jgi:hypothetical protein